MLKVKNLAKSLVRLVRDERAATAIEYAMIASGVSIAIAATVFGLGSKVNGLFTSVSTSLK
jgi:pilus assembly protein Flp/PilA